MSDGNFCSSPVTYEVIRVCLLVVSSQKVISKEAHDEFRYILAVLEKTLCLPSLYVHPCLWSGKGKNSPHFLSREQAEQLWVLINTIDALMAHFISWTLGGNTSPSVKAAVLMIHLA